MEDLKEHATDVLYENWRSESWSPWALYRSYSVTVWLARCKPFVALIPRMIQIGLSMLFPPRLMAPHLKSTGDWYARLQQNYPNTALDIIDTVKPPSFSPLIWPLLHYLARTF